MSEHTEVHFKKVRHRWIIKVWDIGIKNFYITHVIENWTCNYKNGVPAYRRFDIDRYESATEGRLDSGVPSFGFSTHSVVNRQRCDAIVPGRVYWHAIFLSRRARFEHDRGTIKVTQIQIRNAKSYVSVLWSVLLFFL